MPSRKKIMITALIIHVIFFYMSNVVSAVGEEDTFAAMTPEALFLLDLSGSMNTAPGNTSASYVYGVPSCAPSALCNASGCSGGYCNSATRDPDCTTDCSKMMVLKRAVFKVLDDDNSGVIDDNDFKSLGIELGYMRFKDCLLDDADPFNFLGLWSLIYTPVLTDKDLLPCARLVRSISPHYYDFYCGSGRTSCTVNSPPQYFTDFFNECLTSYYTGSGWSILLGGSGNTSLATLQKKTKNYLNDRTRAQELNPDPCGGVKKKFAIVISDGEDTTACGVDTLLPPMDYGRRRSSVTMAKNLADAGYKVFVVGLGTAMPSSQKNTLEWMAYYGQTDNPNVANSGSTSAYNPNAGLSGSGFWQGYNCVSLSKSNKLKADGSACGLLVSEYNCPRAKTNDPGYTNLNGYAYIAGDEDELVAALKNIFGSIVEAAYSFTQSSIQTVRTSDENYIYEASFDTLGAGDPFWLGHLRRFGINANGTVKATADWDAGKVSRDTSGNSRKIYTLNSSGALKEFTIGSMTTTDLDVATATEKNMIVDFIRNGDTAYNLSVTSEAWKHGWKLGDIMRSSPQSIGTPNSLFRDGFDDNNAFASFRAANVRTSANGRRIILAGANDGQLHAFTTSDGTEAWSFIPPNQLPRLKKIAHSTHPTSLIHQHFVDGPLSAADIWLGLNGTSKSANDWRTYLFVTQGRGGKETLWSSSAACTSGFSPTYSSTYNHYCGVFALDVTDTVNPPVYQWKIGGISSGLPSLTGEFLAQPWSKLFPGRVKIGGQEKWVGFIGGGYAGTICAGAGACDKRGKGLFALDLNDGTILQSFKRGDAIVSGSMDYDFAGDIYAVDLYGDGYLDTAYTGDLGANVWRFAFCSKDDDASCFASNWTAKVFFENTASAKQAIFSSPTVARGQGSDVWVYFGTGDQNNPTDTSSSDRLYGIKDNNRSEKFNINDLKNITSRTAKYESSDSSTYAGWYINLAPGEKSLSDPVVFNQTVYFTTYDAVKCNAKVWGVNYQTGAGTLAGGERSAIVGKGIPSGVVISQEEGSQGYNAYVTTSIAAKDTDAHTTSLAGSIMTDVSPVGIQYWKDLRVK